MSARPVARSLDPTICMRHAAAGTGLNPTMEDPRQVRVNGVPIARLGERAYCAFETRDAVVTGATTVLVGGIPIAGVGDSMVHGGLVAGGAPNVFVGGPSAGPAGLSVERDGRRIILGGFLTIDGDDDFAIEILHDLTVLGATPSGRKLLEKIRATGRHVTIRRTTDPNGYAYPSDTDGSVAEGHPVYDGHGERRNHWWGGTDRRGNGEGSDALVELNPDWNMGHPSAATAPPPRDAVLFHELSHAHIYTEGQAMLDPAGPRWDTHEEQRVIEGADPSEADYLRDRGYSHRRVGHCSRHDSCWTKQP